MEKDKKEITDFTFDDALEDDDFDEEVDDKGQPKKKEETKPAEGKDPITEVKDPEGKEGEDNPADPKPTETEKEKQTREENARFAEMRRKEQEKKALEREEAARLKAIEDAKIQAELGILKTNPYTNSPITDKADLEVYKLQKEIDEKGGDPIADYPKEEATRRRIAEAKAKQSLEEEEAKKRESDEKLNNDIKQLHEAYPDVDLAELARDVDYQNYIKGKVGRWTSVEIYEGFLVAKAKIEANKKEKEDKNIVDESGIRVTQVPSSNGGKLPKKSIEDMTDEEYLKKEEKENPDYF